MIFNIPEIYLSIYAIFIAFSSTTILIPLIRELGLKFNLKDLPDNRKQHSFPIVRLGGLAIALSTFLTLFLVNKIDSNNFLHTTYDPRISLLLLGALISFVLGLIDDLVSLSQLVRLIVQFVIAAYLWFGGISINTVDFNFINTINLTYSIPDYLSFLITVFWIVGFANAFNWMDGLDGLAASIASIAFIANIYLSVSSGNHSLLLLNLILLGACLSFLRYNLKPASIFMGDGGSYFLGYNLSTIAILCTSSENNIIPIFSPMMIFFIPLLDMLYVIIDRIKDLKSPFCGDRRHLHHRLLNKGFSENHVLLIIVGFSQFTMFLGLRLYDKNFNGNLLILSISFLVYLLYLANRKRINSEKF